LNPTNFGAAIISDKFVALLIIFRWWDECSRLLGFLTLKLKYPYKVKKKKTIYDFIMLVIFWGALGEPAPTIGTMVKKSLNQFKF
jgi:hypothetical protein